MKRIIYIILIATVCSCSTQKYIPLMPFHVYSKYLKSEIVNSVDVVRAKAGVYVLNLAETDTTFSRKRIKYYTSTPKNHEKIISSIYLYFIDDYRFIYATQRIDTLEISDLNKEYNIGLYKISEKKEGDSPIFMVELLMTKALTKTPNEYETALLLLKLSDDAKILDFHTAYSYFKQTPPRTGTGNFSKEILEKETKELEDNPFRTFESQKMGQYLQWQQKDYPLVTKINNRPFDNVIYSGDNKIYRKYQLGNVTVFRDTLQAPPTTHKITSW